MAAVYDGKTRARFWSKVDRRGSDDCWEWRGSLLPAGYGSFSIKHATHMAHRVAYELANGQIPSGLFVCHSCDNPPCVNPDHLFLGTAKDNTQDMINKERRHRISGEDASWSVLTEDDVKEILRLRQEHGLTTYELAEQFGVHRVTIEDILKGEIWADVPREQAYERLHADRRGEKHHNARLTAEQVREIRRLHKTGKYTHKALAAQYHVNRSTVSMILSRKLWAHLDDEEVDHV